MKNWRLYAAMPVDETRTRPMPFPGPWPTRWKLTLDYSKVRGNWRDAWKNHFRYEGKPCALVAKIYYDLMTKFPGAMHLIEFDRGGAIAMTALNSPRQAASVAHWNYNIFRFYYPWMSDTGVMVTNWADKVVNRQQIEFKGRKFWVYVNGTVGTEAHWREHKAWLETTNLQLTKQ